MSLAAGRRGICGIGGPVAGGTRSGGAVVGDQRGDDLRGGHGVEAAVEQPQEQVTADLTPPGVPAQLRRAASPWIRSRPPRPGRGQPFAPTVVCRPGRGRPTTFRPRMDRRYHRAAACGSTAITIRPNRIAELAGGQLRRLRTAIRQSLDLLAVDDHRVLVEHR